MNEEVITEIAQKINEPMELVEPVMDDEFDDDAANRIDGRVHPNDIYRMRRWFVAQLYAHNTDSVETRGPFIPASHAPRDD